MLGSGEFNLSVVVLFEFQNLIGMLGRREEIYWDSLRIWFQNLIGMLGSVWLLASAEYCFGVSKPYRYARKSHHRLKSLMLLRFQNLIGMLGSLRRERMKITIRQFQNLIGMLGSQLEKFYIYAEK